MKKKILSFLIFPVLVLFALFSGCKYDTVIPEVEVIPGEEISFNDVLIPVFNSGCNLSSCHSPGGVPPDLTPNNAYNSIIDGGYVDLNAPEQSEFYKWVNGEGALPMPISGTDAQLASDVLIWITQGAKNN